MGLYFPRNIRKFFLCRLVIIMVMRFWDSYFVYHIDKVLRVNTYVYMIFFFLSSLSCDSVMGLMLRLKKKYVGFLKALIITDFKIFPKRFDLTSNRQWRQKPSLCFRVHNISQCFSFLKCLSIPYVFRSCLRIDNAQHTEA